MSDYEREMDALRAVSASELVATLRAKARRHGTQTSQYRGVSLLKQTGKWHGQINVGGKQLHLGFFSTEELAARAYDRAAIHKAGAEGGVVVTNLDISLYADEIERLHSMSREELMAMIAEDKRCESAASGKTTAAQRREAPTRTPARLAIRPAATARTEVEPEPPPHRKKGAREGPEDRVRTSFASVPVRWRARWRRRATRRGMLREASGAARRARRTTTDATGETHPRARATRINP